MTSREKHFIIEFDGDITVSKIKQEAQRRIIELWGASDLFGALIKQNNANMRANELNDKRVAAALAGQPDPLTVEEQAEATALRTLADATKVIRAKSNILEASLPENYTDDSHWE